MTHQNETSDLCLLEDVRNYVFRGGGNATKTDDDLLQRLITASSEWIRKEARTNFDKRTYTEIRSGHGGRILFFKYPPVSAVTSLYINGILQTQITSSPADYDKAGYFFTSDHIAIRGDCFHRGRDNIQVTYTGSDYTADATALADLEQTCVEAVAWAYREIDRLGQRSKSLAGEVVSFDMGALSERAQRVIQRYTRVIPI